MVKKTKTPEVDPREIRFEFKSIKKQARQLGDKLSPILAKGSSARFSLPGDELHVLVWPTLLIELMKSEVHLGSIRVDSVDEVLIAALSLAYQSGTSSPRPLCACTVLDF